MKLKEWAEKTGIKYITAYRWFKAGDIPGAYQTGSGTILIPEEAFSEPQMGSVQSNDVMSTVLKKTVELSKNNASVEDFAAWILSNFTLKPLSSNDGPRYSRNKPKSEEVQKHFQQFIKPKGDKPKPNMFVTTDPEALRDLMAQSDDLTAQELVEEIHKIGAEGGVSVNPSDAPEVEELMKDLSSAIHSPKSSYLTVKTYGDIAEGVVTRSVDLTPQQFNYTGSSNAAFGNLSLSNNSVMDTAYSINSISVLNGINSDASLYCANPTAAVSFKPTQKEIESVGKVSAIADKPKRGRKPSKNLGSK